MGVDVGGTHITAAMVDVATKKIIPGSIKRSTVNASGTAEEVIASWWRCMADAKSDREPDQICIAMPGPFDYKDGVSLMRGQNKYESLYGLNVIDALADSMKISPQLISMDNDAACFLQGEVFDGAALAFHGDPVIGVTLGTGLGSATFKNGRSRSADKWCWPFKGSIAEEYLCTRWFVKRWQHDTGQTVTGVRELAALATTNEAAKLIFQDFGNNLADFLGDFISVETPSAVVIGGNISRAWELFKPNLINSLENAHPEVTIMRAELGEHAPLLGAVSSWLEREKIIASFN
jgi:predicted NBD/HSP70 family sugar kinase